MTAAKLLLLLHRSARAATVISSRSRPRKPGLALLPHLPQALQPEPERTEMDDE
jgi:hypothetical protein